METSKYLIRSTTRVVDSPLLDNASTTAKVQLLNENDKEALVIKKLAARLHQSEKNVRELVSERRSVLRLFNDLIRTAFDAAVRNRRRLDDSDDDHIGHYEDDDDEEIDDDDDYHGQYHHHHQDHYDDGLLGMIDVAVADERLVPMFKRPETDGDVLMLSEQYLTLLTRKCHLIKR